MSVYTFSIQYIYIYIYTYVLLIHTLYIKNIRIYTLELKVLSVFSWLDIMRRANTYILVPGQIESGVFCRVADKATFGENKICIQSSGAATQREIFTKSY